MKLFDMPVESTETFIGFKDPQQVFLHMESVYRDLDRVQNAAEVCNLAFKTPLEIEMANSLLNQVTTVTYTSLRTESFKSPVIQLKLRCEGIFTAVWNKVIGFWQWLVKTVKNLFGIETVEATNTQRSQAKEAVNKLDAAVTFQSLFGIEKITGFASSQEIFSRLSGIEHQYESLERAAKVLFTEFSEFNKKDLLSSMIVLKTYEKTKKAFEEASARDVIGNTNKRMFFASINRNFEFTNDKSNQQPKVQLSAVPETEQKDLQFNKADLLKFFETLTRVIKGMNGTQRYFTIAFPSESDEILRVLTKLGTQNKVTAIEKNKLKIIAMFNAYASIAFKMAVEYHGTLQTLKRIELAIFSNLNKPAAPEPVKQMTKEELEKEMANPNKPLVI